MKYRLLTLVFDKDSNLLDFATEAKKLDMSKLEDFRGKDMNGAQMDELVHGIVEPDYSIHQTSITYREGQTVRTYRLAGEESDDEHTA